jgi:integrase
VLIHHGSPIIQEPKSSDARRVVKLRPESVAALRAHRAKPNERRLVLGAIWQDHDLIFCTGEAKLLNPNNLYRNLNAIIARAGVPKVRLHDLRHTHATLLLTAGQPIKAVSERLGHAKTSITIDTDAHMLPRMQDGAVDALRAWLFGTEAA